MGRPISDINIDNHIDSVGNSVDVIDNDDDNAGSLAIDPDGVKIGMVGAMHRNHATHRPDWIVLGTGLFGRHKRLVPESSCRWDGEYVQLRYSRDVIERSPSVSGDRQLTPELLLNAHAYYASA